MEGWYRLQSISFKQESMLYNPEKLVTSEDTKREQIYICDNFALME